jgi:stage II sporulation protein M
MKKSKKRGKGNYRQCWKYLKESKPHFVLIIMIFGLSFLLGFLFPIPPVFLEAIQQFIEDIIMKTEGLSSLQLFWFIFQNNVLTSFVGLFLGLFLGLIPLLVSFVNGYVLGFVSIVSIQNLGVLSLWKLIPHGIFELPALIISLALGLRLGSFILAESGKKMKTLKYNLKNSFRVFIFIIVPLLLIAGLIETALLFLLG